MIYVQTIRTDIFSHKRLRGIVIGLFFLSVLLITDNLQFDGCIPLVYVCNL